MAYYTPDPFLQSKKKVLTPKNEDDLYGQICIALTNMTPKFRERFGRGQHSKKKLAKEVAKVCQILGDEALNVVDFKKLGAFHRVVVLNKKFEAFYDTHAEEKNGIEETKGYKTSYLFLSEINGVKTHHYSLITNVNSFVNSNKNFKWCTKCMKRITKKKFKSHCCLKPKCTLRCQKFESPRKNMSKHDMIELCKTKGLPYSNKNKKELFGILVESSPRESFTSPLFIDFETNGYSDERLASTQVTWIHNGITKNYFLKGATSLSEWVSVNLPHITLEKLDQEGVEFSEMWTDLESDLLVCACIVAHNTNFDIKKVLIGELNKRNMIDAVSTVNDMRKVCTMKQSTNFCKLPKKKGVSYKWPKLTELYQQLFDSNPGGSLHDSRVDCRILEKCYTELVKVNVISPLDFALTHGFTASVPQNKKMTDANLIMNFGKYEGENFKDIIKKDPGYIKWIASDEFKKTTRTSKIKDAACAWYKTCPPEPFVGILTNRTNILYRRPDTNVLLKNCKLDRVNSELTRSILTSSTRSALWELKNTVAVKWCDNSAGHSEFGCFVDYLCRRLIAEATGIKSIEDMRAKDIVSLKGEFIASDDGCICGCGSNIWCEKGLTLWVPQGVRWQVQNPPDTRDTDTVQTINADYCAESSELFATLKSAYDAFCDIKKTTISVLADVLSTSSCHTISFNQYDHQKSQFLKSEVCRLLNLSHLEELKKSLISISRGITSENVHLNPVLGHRGIPADADLILDDNLIDIKTSKMSSEKDWLQVYAYAALNDDRSKYKRTNFVHIFNPIIGTVTSRDITDWSDDNRRLFVRILGGT